MELKVLGGRVSGLEVWHAGCRVRGTGLVGASGRPAPRGCGLGYEDQGSGCMANCVGFGVAGSG